MPHDDTRLQRLENEVALVKHLDLLTLDLLSAEDI